MEIKEHVKMAKSLFKKGKFDKQIAKDLSRFEPLKTEGVVFAGEKLDPYYDNERDMVVFGTIESQANRDRLRYITFRDFEYRFNESGEYVWYDKHTYGFKDIKKKK